MAELSKVFRQVQDLAAKADRAAKEVSEQLSATMNQTYETVAPTINDIAKNAGEFASQVYITTGERTGEVENYVKEQAKTISQEVSKVLSLDEIGYKIASLGTPAIAFAVASSIAGGMGLAGGAVVTTALAMLGGPLGMIGGLITLGALTAIADAVSKYGIHAVLVATFRAKQGQEVSISQILKEIDSLWISDDLKRKVKQQLTISGELSEATE